MLDIDNPANRWDVRPQKKANMFGSHNTNTNTVLLLACLLPASYLPVLGLLLICMLPSSGMYPCYSLLVLPPPLVLLYHLQDTRVCK